MDVTTKVETTRHGRKDHRSLRFIFNDGTTLTLTLADIICGHVPSESLERLIDWWDEQNEENS
jgi:hypothetical protein